jgi:hypothetical protein
MKTRIATRALPILLIAGALAAGSVHAQTTTGTIVVKKFYDANANGIRDTGEPWLSGWPMSVTGDGVDSTKNSTATFSGLAGGSYSVGEAAPLESNWVQTAPRVGGVPVNPKDVTVTPCYTTTVKFGNYCKKASGGRTPGFWSNQNGQAKLNDGLTMDPELGLLSSLNLVDASGNAFDPATYDSFRTWLLASTATNMAYKLSSHLAAMRLNVEAGFVNGNRIYAPFGGTINQLMTLADNSLAAHPLTLTGNPERAYQEQLKDYLDALNNGAAVVSPTPCTFSFY